MKRRANETLSRWIRRVLVGAVLLGGVGCAVSGTTPDPGRRPHAPTTPIGADPFPQRPALYAPVRDPTFGTVITRVTDAGMELGAASAHGVGLRHEYSRFPALNADNTKVAVRVLGGAERGSFEIRDVARGARVAKLAIHRGDPEMSWHPTAPNLLFYRSGDAVYIFHADTGRTETRMEFPQYFAIGTRGEGRPSDDWRYYAFLGFPDQSFAHPDLVVVDLAERRMVARRPDAGKPDWVGMSPSGKYVVAQWTNGQGTRLYDRATLAYVRTLFSDAAHSDFAFDGEGNEVIVYHATSKAQLEELGNPTGCPIALARLADGEKRKLLDVGWNWFTPHFSGIASRRRPGWVLVSTYTSPENPPHPYAREVFWLKLDGSGEVRHVAHHHSDQARTDKQKDYWAEPQATSSWDGNIVLFSSVWGQPFGRYDLYMVKGQWWEDGHRAEAAK
jgi:hypothetical protein